MSEQKIIYRTTEDLVGVTRNEFVRNLANRSIKTEYGSTAETTELEGQVMESLLRKSGLFPNCRIVCGVVYLEGVGHPTSLVTVAQMILDVIEKESGNQNGNKTH